MTAPDEPPGRWPRDSEAEDFEAHRQAEMDGLKRWMAEQKARPLTDELEAHGVLPGDGQGWAGPLALPPWWDEIPEPVGRCCPWCQRPDVPAPCPECRTARAADADPPAVRAWWARCTPAQRRLNIAGSYSIDPWSGRRCTIRIEWTDLDAEGQIRTTYPLWFGAAPAGIYWGAARRG